MMMAKVKRAIPPAKPANVEICPFCGLVVKKEDFMEHIKDCDARKSNGS